MTFVMIHDFEHDLWNMIHDFKNEKLQYRTYS